MKRFSPIARLMALLAVCAVSLAAAAQTLTVSATHLQDRGAPLSNATISFTPVLNNGHPVGFRAGANGGQNTVRPVTAQISNGAFSVPLADTFLTSPRYLCYQAVITDNATGATILKDGYGCLQPSADPAESTWCATAGGSTTCNFDAYPTNLAGLVQVQQGPVGPAGANGASAYQLAVQGGFVGSLSQWLASLQNGPVGPAGTQGPQGLTGAQGVQGLPGLAGATGPQGLQGIQGLIGPAATVTIGTVTTLAAGSQATVTNVGTSGAAVLNIGIPVGQPGSGSGVADGSLSAIALNTATGGNPANGIANADTAPSQVVAIGPSYGATDATHLFPANDGSIFHDTRPGFEGNRYRNCLYQAGTGLNFQENACQWNAARFTAQPNNNGALASQSLGHHAIESFGKSTNYSGAWRLTQLRTEDVRVSNRGISSARTLNFYKNAIGDVNVDDVYAWVYGGWKTQSDEGVVGQRFYLQQPAVYYVGTSQSSGTGLTLPLLSNNTVAPAAGQPQPNSTLDGGILLDVSKGTLSGTITGAAVPLAGSGYLYQYAAALTGGGTLPLNTGWAYCPGSIPLQAQPMVDTSVTLTCQLKLGSFTAGGSVWIAGPNYPQQAPITAVGAVTGTAPNQTQTITLTAHHPQAAGINLIQGPTVGQYLSLDAVLSQTGQRTTEFNFGSMDGVNLVAGFWVTGGSNQLLSCGASPFCPGVTGADGWHSFPGAEIVANHSLLHDPELEVGNTIPFSVGDTIESPAPDAMTMTAYKAECGQQTLANGGLSPCWNVGIYGSGVNGNVDAALIHNDNPFSMYIQNGGWAFAPNALHIRGYFDRGVVFDTWPGKGLMQVSNMGTVTGQAPVIPFPSDTLYWENANHMLYITGLSSQYFRGPLVSPSGSCPASQSGYWAFGMDAKIRNCEVANGATTGTWTDYAASGGGGGASVPAAPTTGDTTPPLCNVAGSLQNCTPDQMAAALASPKTFQMTGGVGTGTYANQCPTIPGAGLVSLVVNFDPTSYSAGALTCPAVLDASGNAHFAQLFSDGTQSVLGGPPPALTYPVFYAMALQQDPNVGVNGADCSQFVGTGHCTLPPGITPSFVGSSGPNWNAVTSTSTSQTYTVQRAGAALIVSVFGPTANGDPSSVVSSSGQTGTFLGSTSETTRGNLRMSVYAFQNHPAGAATVTVNYATAPASYGNYAITIDEFQSVPTTGSYYESVVASAPAQTAAVCSTVTTTATNELVYVAASGDFNLQHPYPAPQAPLTQLTTSTMYTHGLPTAGTYVPTFQGNIDTCVAFALKHK